MEVAHEDAVVLCFREELPVPLGSEGDTQTRIDTRFINGVGRENLRGRNCGWKETEERVEYGYCCNTRRCKVLSPMIEAAAAGDIKVDVRVRRDMNDGIKGCHEDVDVAAGHAETL